MAEISLEMAFANDDQAVIEFSEQLDHVAGSFVGDESPDIEEVLADLLARIVELRAHRGMDDRRLSAVGEQNPLGDG